MPYVERPATKLGRIGWLLLAWALLFGPFTVAMFFWFGWWALIVLAALIWMSDDYLKRGAVKDWEESLPFID